MKIDIAGHCLALLLDDADALELGPAYALFASTKSPEITISVRVSPNCSTANGAWGECILHNDFMHYVDDSAIGWVDFSLRQGMICALPGRLQGSLGSLLRNIITILVMRSSQGAVLHGACIVHNREALVFIGQSGAGKSTVAKLSPGKTILSDEHLFIQKGADGFMCFPAPGWGDMQQNVLDNKPYRVSKIFKLVQDEAVFVRHLSRAQAIADTFSVPDIILSSRAKDNLLPVFEELLEQAPLYALHFRKDATFWSHIESLNDPALCAQTT